MLRFRAAKNIFRSKFGLRRDLASAALSVEVLEHGFVEEAPLPVTLPEMNARVTRGVPGHSTAAQELAVATQSSFVHAPVVRYTLPDCIVHRGGVEYRGGYVPKTTSRRDRFPMGRIREQKTGHYCMTHSSHTYFGHWLRGSCSTALLAEPGARLVLDERPDWPDTADYLDAFGLTATLPEALYFETLHVYSDFSQGHLKRQRYAALKARLRARRAAEQKQLVPIYLRRGMTGATRQIANEEALCDRLSAAGFEILDLATSNFSDRICKLAQASVLVSIDGSHVNHGHFSMQPGSRLITLIPSDRFTMTHRGISYAMGMAYGYVVIQPSDGGYRVDPDDVMRTIDLMS